MEKKKDMLKLENQICFPLYACSREIIKLYTPYLEELGLTYTQYITMMVLWEQEQINVKELGERLFLDSGTLSSLLRKLEAKGYVSRDRSKTDERQLTLRITPEGDALKEHAAEIPMHVAKCVSLNEQESMQLYKLLNKLLFGKPTGLSDPK